MSIKKTFFIYLLCFLMLTVFIFPSSAAEISGFYSSSMEHTAFTFENVNNVLERVDYTDKLTVSSGTYSGESCTTLTIPFDTTNTFRYVSSYHIENLSASHEYNLKFKASCSVLSSVGTTALGVYLVFYNGDTILKEQELGGCEFNSLGWQKVDFDFKPDASGLGGYKTRLEFRFVSVTSAAVIYRLSDIIEFTDKDDNSGWFQRIINAIKEIPEKIGDLRDNISNYFSALGDRITAKFESVGTSITNKFEEVKNAIGSWFTEIGDKLSNKFAEVGNAITSKFQEIGDEFSSRFDIFKPRFYEVFDWTLGMLNTDGTIDNYEDFGLAVTSNAFFVPNGSKYIVNLTSSNLFNSSLFDDFYFMVSYIEDGVIYDVVCDSMSAFLIDNPDGIVLEPGVSYYFSIQNFGWDSFESYFGTYDLDDLCNSVVKVYADEGWLTAFGRMILNGIKNFFETLKNNILYFQSPVTLNSDGILVDVNGEPVYVNPFGEVTFADTIKGWADDLLDFSSSIDDSADTVSEWLSTMSNIINKMLKRIPILSGLLIFAVVFIVVRKVVGR